MKYLIHADGAFPNLALMRLARFFRDQGETVRLVRGRGRELWDKEPGEVYGSSIFAFSAEKRAAAEKEWGAVRWGGTGVDEKSDLAEIAPIDWEAVKPDYSDYPSFTASIGFSQRGCRLKCPFCVVPRKEGKPASVRSILDIYRGEGHPRRILLLDNDFFGVPAPVWRERLKEVKDGEFRISFCQGINIRQMDEESSRALAATNYWDTQFERRRLYTAWDNLKEEAAFRKGFGLLTGAGIPAKHIMVYMLVGYAQGETWDEVLHRWNVIMGLGGLAFPMVYNNARPDLKAFQRWACRGFYKSIPWEKYRDPRLGNGSGKGMRIG